MSYDQNEIHISGTVESFKVISTKTGTPMIKFFVRCNKEKISVVSFNELAESTQLNDGEEVSIIVSAQGTPSSCR